MTLTPPSRLSATKAPLKINFKKSLEGVPVCTCGQAQLREVTLQEENDAYENAISNCESKIQEKIEEAELLRRKLEELEDTEKNLRDELENAQTALDTSRSRGSDEAVGNSKTSVETGDDMESSKKAILDMLEERKRELSACAPV
ncbi:uncharacterized protein LOC133744559 [Rosa rugosa]|uniref:uncharacterized protein LOC133744559 n=1 Tax=Rosa rugosa TaxID=74645 RepID=UPI002B415763|nr:uncharacterized protein LOC133744559 [Rosa rugosa]